MLDRIRAAFGGRQPEASEPNDRLLGAYATDAGMHCVWRPAAFASVHDYETWDSQLSEDGDILRHVSAGDFVPINIRSDGAFEIEVRVGSASSPAALSERDRTYLEVESEPYRFISDGELCLSGIEHVHEAPDAHVGRLALSPGEYAVVVHLIGWNREPGMLTASGSRSPDALPDFIVAANPTTGRHAYRTRLETFSGSP